MLWEMGNPISRVPKGVNQHFMEFTEYEKR
jgi:hypothetical protein